MKVAEIPEIIIDINRQTAILNNLKNNFKFEHTNFNEIEKLNKIKDDIFLLTKKLHYKLSFPITIETMNSKEFLQDIQKIVVENDKIKELSANQKGSNYSSIQNAYFELELLAENMIFKYSK